MIINHSVCFLVWYVTYQYISHLGCLNFFSLFKIFNMQFSKNNQRNFMFRSGDKGIRTLDPLLARQVLSQLSYTPMGIWQPPALPYRLQYSTIGRLGLNHRVRDENGCVPQAHRHQKCSYFGFLHRRCALRITTSSLSFSDLPLANQQ